MDQKVIDYLVLHYDIDAEDAEDAVEEYMHMVDMGITLGHSVQTIALKIADQLDLEEKDEDD